jgi:hypothetical protein
MDAHVMTRNEIVALLAVAAAYDQRSTGTADVDAWLAALGDLTAAECGAAIVAYYQEEVGHYRVWVGNIRQRVLDARIQWLQQHPNVGPAHPEIVAPWEQRKELGP